MRFDASWRVAVCNGQRIHVPLRTVPAVPGEQARKSYHCRLEAVRIHAQPFPQEPRMAIQSFQSITDTNCKRALRNPKFIDDFLATLDSILMNLEDEEIVEFLGALAMVIETITGSKRST
jgi:hypothetical protein